MGSGSNNQPAVSARNLRKRFGALEVLKGISLDAHEGDVISILGASGSGKSTLLRCINLLEIPDDGEVVVAGESIALRTGRRGRREPVDRAQVVTLVRRIARTNDVDSLSREQVQDVFDALDGLIAARTA